ncbi:MULTISPECIES: lysophospholipid acyltransferase family protein [unclassified Caballeronia]|uniref:lysophospholipid acyltransferase family protein n=1 Tax=unclassified Caballeronia TaxID=2646786 RepID=UPI002866CBD2|nr:MULTISPECIES: lysophospholipid acyltransferase family protein [unclassified Caballeronia]MDR5754216.1 lysophospholipid acyltransferase family protein [Caballeronia sp. LZ024]MDR5840594.1 lysophospholipid acyltransferase family protein [Caballeronia sp. LZ031]
MPARADFIWRLLATGASFVVFGVCGLLFSVLVFPFASIWPHRVSRQRAVTAIIHVFFRTLVAALQKLGVMRLDIANGSALRTGAPMIVVANHPTYLDVMILLALTPSACCVVKHAHWRNPCFWGIVRAAEYVSNAAPPELVESASRQLGAGYTMIIFPEGTRSPAPDRLHAFSRGFAHIALKADAPILPVLIDCDPPAFTKQMRWYHVPSRPFRLRLYVLEPINAAAIAAQHASTAIAARALTQAVEAHINQRLLDHGFFKT